MYLSGRKRVLRDMLLAVPLHLLGHSEVMLPEGSKVCVQFLSPSPLTDFGVVNTDCEKLDHTGHSELS